MNKDKLNEIKVRTKEANEIWCDNLHPDYIVIDKSDYKTLCDAPEETEAERDVLAEWLSDFSPKNSNKQTLIELARQEVAKRKGKAECCGQ